MIKSEYLLYGESDYDFNDRSAERMDKLNEQLKKKIDRVKKIAAEKGYKPGPIAR